jgi:hypothetical protein
MKLVPNHPIATPVLSAVSLVLDVSDLVARGLREPTVR